MLSPQMQAHRCCRAGVSNPTRQRRSVCLYIFRAVREVYVPHNCGDAFIASSSLLATSTCAFSPIRCLSLCATETRSYHRGRITAQHPLGYSTGGVGFTGFIAARPTTLAAMCWLPVLS